MVEVNQERVNHPSHYNSLSNGVECADVIEGMEVWRGDAIKYIWRAGLKSEEGLTRHDKEIEDLEKAKWWLDRRIKQLKTHGDEAYE